MRIAAALRHSALRNPATCQGVSKEVGHKGIGVNTVQCELRVIEPGPLLSISNQNIVSHSTIHEVWSRIFKRNRQAREERITT
jgi:hypothetical protein